MGVACSVRLTGLNRLGYRLITYLDRSGNPITDPILVDAVWYECAVCGVGSRPSPRSTPCSLTSMRFHHSLLSSSGQGRSSGRGEDDVLGSRGQDSSDRHSICKKNTLVSGDKEEHQIPSRHSNTAGQHPGGHAFRHLPRAMTRR